MTNAQFKKQMEIYGNDFYGNTCYKTKLEIIKKIINCKAIPDGSKIILIDQYTKGLVTNNCVVESIIEFRKQ